MKLEQSGQMFRHVDPVVTAGVEVEIMGNMARAKYFVQSYGTGVEAKIVFGAAIKVDLQSGESRGARDGQRVILFPEYGIERRAEDVTENPRPGKLAGIAGRDPRKFCQQGRARNRKGAEKPRVAERPMQGSPA